MFDIPAWPNVEPSFDPHSLELLIADAETEIPPNTTVNDVIEKSKVFPIPFPIETVRCSSLVNYTSTEVLEKNINSVYPVIHENALLLYVSFLLFKRKFGSNIERDLYQNMTVIGLVDRLLNKRAVSFMDGHDAYVLLDGSTGFGKWEKIGTDAQTERLNLNKYISYDEIKLSALLSVSSYTQFINNGNRFNNGKRSSFNVEPEGIIIGLIGTRFEKSNVMEYQEVLISKEQNTEQNGYGTQFAPTMKSLVFGFYGEVPVSYTQFLSMKESHRNRYNLVYDETYFDNVMYCKRLALSIDTLLLEANDRAVKGNTTAFVHVVGIGLGVWKVSAHQNQLFLDTFAKRIIELGNHLNAVSDIVFAYFNENSTCGGYGNGAVIPVPHHPNNGIKIEISRREPQTKLTGSDEGKLLVVSYAWDGNALPGNEFWLGSLSGSGDPAAASSTQIAEIHNSHINRQACAENLRIATLNGVIPYVKYCQNLRDLQRK